MSRYASAGSRWAKARNAHCSSWAQKYNQQFRAMTAGSSYLLKTCEYFPALQGGVRKFPEGVGNSSITQLLADLTDDSGSSKLAGVDEAVTAYLSGWETVPYKLESTNIMFWTIGSGQILDKTCCI